jgi:hypothetical protein
MIDIDRFHNHLDRNEVDMDMTNYNFLMDGNEQVEVQNPVEAIVQQ